LRVAIIHDWLVTYAGSERVLEQMLGLFPQADLFSLFDFVPKHERHFLQGKQPRTSFLQRAPLARTKYPRYLSLMPLAIEQFDLSNYDLILSSSHCVAKGVLTGPDQLHICYMHSPMRYAWDLQHEYLRGAGLDRGLKSWIARWLLQKLRLWDVRSASGVDAFVSNSRFIARRIEKAYRRQATVIYPPVDVDAFSLREQKDDFYLTASRLVPYKRVDLLVQAFAELPDKRLVVVGDGPELARLRAQAGPNVRLVGYQDFDVLRDCMERARAFLFASQEDFGIVLVEAQACGTPVIAFGKGGALETVLGQATERPTGMFFMQQTVASLVQAIKTFERERDRFEPAACRENAQRFHVKRFREQFSVHVAEQWNEFQARHEVGPVREMQTAPEISLADFPLRDDRERYAA
jgi:glycosyltransferase involved in cell wall biosynthesis